VRNSPADSTPLRDDRGSAVLSDDGQYRYRLSRTWDVEQPTLGWIMLNPSTADATEDDPTIRRCLGYARDWGYGSIIVGNLFALRATDPDDLHEHPAPVGSANDEHLQAICEEADRVIAAWGTKGAIDGRASEVVSLLDEELYALDTTKDGHPNHPLYQPQDADPQPFDYAEHEVRCDGGEEFVTLDVAVSREVQVPIDSLGEDVTQTDVLKARAEDWFWGRWVDALANAPEPSIADVSVSDIDLPRHQCPNCGHRNLTAVLEKYDGCEVCGAEVLSS